MDPTEAVKAAANHGWEAALVAFAMLSAFAGLGLLVRMYMTQASLREERMAKRIDQLEDFIRTNLTKLISDCQGALDRTAVATAALREALVDRPCLAPEHRQANGGLPG